ncbi:MAG: hypothetical protein M9918_25665, partial [Anaerolineae bacterium]|nr:hypothetical protein [Anaerolineae bacterium]
HLRPIGDIVNYSKVRYLSTSGGHVSEVYAFILQGDPALKMPSTPEPPMPPTPTPTATPSPTMTPEFTPTPGPSPTPTLTPTPSPTPVDVKYIPVVKG